MDENKDFFVGPTYKNDTKTGLSHFILSTIETSDDISTARPIFLHGLLSDLPEFSFTVNYEDGPGTEWQDMLSNFMANDLMSIFNAIGSAKKADFVNLVKAGTWTKQVYNGYSPSTIPLKFRIYTKDTLGQSSPQKWKDTLIKYASISRDNEFDIKNAAHNIVSTISNAYYTGEEAADLANAATMAYSNMGNRESPQTDTEKLNEKNAKNQSIFTKLNETLDSVVSTFNNSGYKGSARRYTIAYNIEQVAADGDGTKIYLTFSLKDSATGFNNQFDSGRMQIGILNAQKVDDAKFEHSDFETAYNAFVEKIRKYITAGDNEMRDMKNDLASAGLPSKINEIYSDTDAENSEDNDIEKALGFIGSVADSMGDLLTKKYTDKRVYQSMNVNNCLGEKLWHLTIYNNVIFKSSSPLIVYISNWSYKPSEEVVDDMPVYYDFNITCALDQVYSRETWFNKLIEPEVQRTDDNLSNF